MEFDLSVPDHCLFLPIRYIRLGLTCPQGIRILFLLEGSAFKYTLSYDEVKNKFTLTFRKPRSKHNMSIKTSLYQSILHTQYICKLSLVSSIYPIVNTEYCVSCGLP